MRTEPTGTVPFDSVAAYLGRDHDRLDAIVTEVADRVQAGKMEEALTTFQDFDQGLRRHIRIEEELLFPVFERRTGIVGGPTSVMREEHREIQRALTLMGEGLEAGDAERFRQGLRLLLRTLPAHNTKEEQVLYPATDRVLSDLERTALVARLVQE